MIRINPEVLQQGAPQCVTLCVELNAYKSESGVIIQEAIKIIVRLTSPYSRKWQFFYLDISTLNKVRV